MKPKERYAQTQTSRLNIRNNDHRDIVYEDTYINALYYEDDEQEVDGLVWLRYPEHCVIDRYVDYNNEGTRLGYFDTKRQLFHTIQMPYSNSNRLITLDKFFINISSTAGAGTAMNLSEDGCIWKPLRGTVGNIYYAYRVGLDEVAYWNMSYGGQNMYAMVGIISQDYETGQWRINWFQSHLSVDDSPFGQPYKDQPRYLATSRTGCLIGLYAKSPEDSKYYGFVYEITTSDIRFHTLIDERIGTTASDYINLFNRAVGCDSADVSYGQKNVFLSYMDVHKSVIEGGDGLYHRNTIVVDADSGGFDILAERKQSGSYPNYPQLFLCNKHGIYHAYQYADNKLTVWNSLMGGGWTEYSVPSAIEFKVSKDGRKADQSIDTDETIVLHLYIEDESQYIEGDRDFRLDLSSLADTDKSYGNVTASNGKIDPTHSYMRVKGRNVSNRQIAYFYFDNMMFNQSSNNIAYIIQNGGYDAEWTEKVISGDYCVKK